MTLFGPYLAACLLLVIAGVAKAAVPTPAQDALATVLGPGRWRPPPGRRPVRVIAALEIAGGLAGIARPAGAAASIVGVIYLGFAGFVVLARRRGGQLASCGCFGVPDTPATRLHVVINLGLAAAAADVAIAARSGWVWSVLGTEPTLGIPLVLAAALLAALAAAAMTLLPRLYTARAPLR